MRRFFYSVWLGIAGLCLMSSGAWAGEAGEMVSEDKDMQPVVPFNFTQKPVRGGSSVNKGWPDGRKDQCVRFIRMEYDGPGWDDGMDATSRADLNFLEAFHAFTGFKIATNSVDDGRVKGHVSLMDVAALGADAEDSDDEKSTRGKDQGGQKPTSG